MDLEIELEDELYGVLRERADANGFESTEEYCSVVLELVVEELEREGAGEEVEERLEDLGYLS